MSTPYGQQPTFTPADQVPTETFKPMPPRFADESTQAIPAHAPGPVPGQPLHADGTPAYTSNGFTAQERAARPAGSNSGHGPVGNWLRTGDSKLNVDSEQGRALGPAIPDAWSITSLILAFFVPLAGVIVAFVAFGEAKKNQRRVHGTAIGGFFVGLLGSIAWTLYWVFVIVAMAALTNAVNSNPYGG